MELFGLQPVEIVLIICIVGTTLRVYTGRLKNPGTKLDVNAIILSFMVGIIASVGLVAPVISSVPNDIDKIILLPILAGQIIVVMKSESLATTMKKLIPSKPKTISEVKNGP